MPWLEPLQDTIVWGEAAPGPEQTVSRVNLTLPPLVVGATDRSAVLATMYGIAGNYLSPVAI